jgi:hypothetical protein
MTGGQAAPTHDDPFQIGTSPRNAVPGIAGLAPKSEKPQGRTAAGTDAFGTALQRRSGIVRMLAAPDWRDMAELR